MSLNRVFLFGNLGKDPELRYTPTQQAVCNFSLATSEVRKTPDGERTEQTEWHNIVVWGKQAENCKQYLAKGSKVLIEGRIQTRKWQDQQGNTRYTTEIVANNVQFVGGREDGPRAGGNMNSNMDQSSGIFGESASSFGSSPSPANSNNAVTLNTPISLEDDDIPF